MLFRRKHDRLRPLDEAAAYARCHGDRDESVRVVKLPPRRARYDLLATGEEIRRRFEERIDARDPDPLGPPSTPLSRPPERPGAHRRAHGAPLHLAVATAHSSSGLGHRPLTAAARVRIPYGPFPGLAISDLAQPCGFLVRGSTGRRVAWVHGVCTERCVSSAPWTVRRCRQASCLPAPAAPSTPASQPPSSSGGSPARGSPRSSTAR